LLILSIIWEPHTGQQIVRAEYFIDVDPGYGNGTVLAASAATHAETILTIPLSGLKAGMHTLYARVRAYMPPGLCALKIRGKRLNETRKLIIEL